MYFKKLNLQFNIPSYKVGKKLDQYGFDINNKFNGLWYSDIKINGELNLIPERYKSDFDISLLEANSFILPHSDSGSTSVINFYIETNNCATQFYEVKDDAKPYQIDNQTNGFVYDLNDLVEKASFIAEPKDIYILDVSKVHSVIPLHDGQINRKAICLSTNKFKFDELEKIFN